MKSRFACASSYFLVLLLACILSVPLYAKNHTETYTETQQKNSVLSHDFSRNFKQTYLSCAIITSEHLTVLQLYQRGLPKKVAIDSLPRITRNARKRVDYIYDLANDIGVLNAYSDINTNFARCSTLVYQVKGLPATDQKEYAYYYCSGENKIRFELLLQLNSRMSLDKIYQTLPPSHYHVAKNYQQLFKKKGLLSVFDYTANNLKACLKLIE